MALRYFDGFEQYTTTAHLLNNPVYGGAPAYGSVASGAPSRSGARHYYCTGNFGQHVMRVQPGWSSNTVGVGFGIYLDASITDSGKPACHEFYAADMTVGYPSVRILPGGVVGIFQAGLVQGGVSPLATSAAGVINQLTWYHMEIMCTVLPSAAGSITVRVNGVEVVTYTNLTARSTTGPTTFLLAGTVIYDYAVPRRYDDMFYWDTAGGGVVSWYGDGRVSQLLPTSNTTTNWTVTGTASRAAAVAETAPDGDTTYIQATAASTETLVLSDLPGTAVTVGGVITATMAAKTDAGISTFLCGLASGGSAPTTSPVIPSTTTYNYANHLQTTDPATGVAWTPAAINAAVLHVERVT